MSKQRGKWHPMKPKNSELAVLQPHIITNKTQLDRANRAKTAMWSTVLTLTRIASTARYASRLTPEELKAEVHPFWAQLFGFFGATISTANEIGINLAEYRPDFVQDVRNTLDAIRAIEDNRDPTGSELQRIMPKWYAIHSEGFIEAFNFGGRTPGMGKPQQYLLDQTMTLTPPNGIYSFPQAGLKIKHELTTELKQIPEDEQDPVKKTALWLISFKVTKKGDIQERDTTSMGDYLRGLKHNATS